MPWLWIMVGIGLALPVAVVAVTIVWGTQRVPGSSRVFGAALLGLAIGALGGLMVSAVVIGLALGLRALR